MNAIQYFDWGSIDNGIVTMDIDITYTKNEYKDILRLSLRVGVGEKNRYEIWKYANFLTDATKEEIIRECPKLGYKIPKEELPTLNKKIERNVTLKEIAINLYLFYPYDDFQEVISNAKAWVNGRVHGTKRLYSDIYPRTGLSGSWLVIDMNNTKIGKLPNHLNIKIQI